MVSTSTGSDPRRRDSRLSVSARRLNRCHAEDDDDEDAVAPPLLLHPMMAVESSDRIGLRISAPPEDRRRMAFFALRRLMPKLFRMMTLLVVPPPELSQGTEPRRCMLYAGPILLGRVVATTISGWFWLVPPFGWSFVCMVMNSAGMEPRRRSHDLMTNDTLSSGSAVGLGGRATVTGADPRRRLRLRFSIDGSRFSFWPPPEPLLPSRPRESFGILALSAFSAEDESCSRLVAASFLMDTRMPRDSLSASGALLEELLLLLDSRSASGQAPSSAWEDMYRVRMYGCNGGKVC